MYHLSTLYPQLIVALKIHLVYTVDTMKDRQEFKYYGVFLLLTGMAIGLIAGIVGNILRSQVLAPAAILALNTTFIVRGGYRRIYKKLFSTYDTPNSGGKPGSETGAT